MAGFAATGPVATAAPTYHGVFVLIDPYRKTDMNFLSCAATGTSLHGKTCAVTPADNPFIPVGGSATSAATGILLRLPWCGFETDGLPHGSCHYRVEDNHGSGQYLAGKYSNGQLQITTTPPALAQDVDNEIDYLSTCRTLYDECPGGVTAAAFKFIAQINAATPIGLSLGLEAGIYTPIPVMDSDGSVDLPVTKNKAASVCTRQPLAWKNTYIARYDAAVTQLLHDLTTYPGGSLPSLTNLKVGAIGADSLEFDVGARTAIFTTDLDPAGTIGDGPDQDPVLICPDHLLNANGTPQTGVDALLAAYGPSPAGALTMDGAYELAFGTTVGFQAGLLAAKGLLQPGGTGAILSIQSKGQQAFAHVACDTISGGVSGQTVLNQPLLTGPCVPDPTAGVSNYSWSEYYFMRFVTDLFIPGTAAYRNAAAAFTKAANAPYTLTAQQLAVVYTGLQAKMSVPFTSLLSCWLNNTNPNAPYAQPLLLFATPQQSDQISLPGPVLTMPGTLLGWEFASSASSTCPANFGKAVQSGVQNGAQFLEVDAGGIDTAPCRVPLQSAVAALVPSNAQSQTCLY